MASPKPSKRLGEFLKEQQEPFILELYLLEKGYSSNNGESGKCLERFRWSINKKRSVSLFQFSKVLTTLHKKLVFHNQSCILIRDSDIIDDQHVHVNVETTDQTIDDIDRFSFSTATNSTVYLSCSDIDEDGISLSPHKDKALLSPNASQTSNIEQVLQSEQATDNEEHHQRCLEGSPVPESRNISVTDGALNQDAVSGMEERMSSCCVFVPKKIITEDSLLSVALWSSLIQSEKREKCRKEMREFLGANPDVCHVLKSKTLLRKAKRLLFYCVREISTKKNLTRKDCRRGQQQQYLKQLTRTRRPEELGKIIWERTRELGGNEINNNLLGLDDDDEWSELKPQLRQICVEVAEAVLERVTYDIVAEMIQV